MISDCCKMRKENKLFAVGLMQMNSMMRLTRGKRDNPIRSLGRKASVTIEEVTPEEVFARGLSEWRECWGIKSGAFVVQNTGLGI
jgi:hypothetical protein